MADNSDTTTLTLSPGDRDAMVRTVIGEASNQPDSGKSAVAHVIMNRVIDGGYGPTPTAVVLAPNQFEPWSTRGEELRHISPNSPEYRDAARIVDGVLSGETPDPTNGAKNFLNPDTVMQRSGRLPKWAQGAGVQIGDHVFLNGRDAETAPDAPTAIDRATNTPQRGALPSVALAFNSGETTPPGTQPPAASPNAPSALSDDALEAMILGKAPSAAPATPTGAPPPFAASPAPNVSTMSDDDLAKLIAGPTPVTSKGGAKPPLTPDQVASGVDPQTGERVVGGKPFTSDRSHWNGWLNFANGGLQGFGTDVAAATSALKAKLYDNDPLPLNKLFDQAKSTYEGGRSTYQGENPLLGPVSEGAGSLATAIPAIAAGGAGIGAAGNALLDSARAVPMLARAVPAAEAAGSFIGGTAGEGSGVANMLLRGASRATQGAGQGATFSAISSSLSDRPIFDQMREGGIVGAGAGLAFPAAASAAKSLSNKLLGAGSVDPAAAALAKTAQDTYGIPIRGGQLAESPGVRFMDSTLSRTPGMGYSGDVSQQNAAFNRAVSNTIGEDADKITPTVMSAAKTRIGAVMDDVAAKTTIHQDAPFVEDLTRIANEAKGVLVSSELKPLQTQARNIVDKFSQDGSMTGEAYQALVRKGSPLDRLMNSNDSNLRHYAGQVRDALDDALERSAAPEDLARLREARGQYKAMKTIEPLVEKSITGDISPAALTQAVRSSYGNMAYGGGGPLGDLSRIGQKFLKDIPSSGSAERIANQGFLNKLGAIGAGAFGIDKLAPYVTPHLAPEAIPYTLASMLGSYGAGRVASSVLRSPAYANMLINTSLGLPAQSGPVNRLLGTIPKVAPQLGALSVNRLLGPPTPASP